MESGLRLVSVIIPVLLILLSPEPPCFPLQECKITTMVRAETFQIFQYDVLALRNHQRGRVWTSSERKHILATVMMLYSTSRCWIYALLYKVDLIRTFI